MKIRIIRTIHGMKEIKINMVFKVFFETKTYYTFLFNDVYYSIYKRDAEIVGDNIEITEENKIIQISFFDN